MEIQILKVKGDPYLVIGDKDPNSNPMTVGEWSFMIGDRVRYEELQSSLSVEEIVHVLQGDYYLIVDGEAKGLVSQMKPQSPA